MDPPNRMKDAVGRSNSQDESMWANSTVAQKGEVWMSDEYIYDV